MGTREHSCSPGGAVTGSAICPGPWVGEKAIQDHLKTQACAPRGFGVQMCHLLCYKNPSQEIKRKADPGLLELPKFPRKHAVGTLLQPGVEEEITVMNNDPYKGTRYKATNRRTDTPGCRVTKTKGKRSLNQYT